MRYRIIGHIVQTGEEFIDSPRDLHQTRWQANKTIKIRNRQEFRTLIHATKSDFEKLDECIWRYEPSAEPQKQYNFGDPRL